MEFFSKRHAGDVGVSPRLATLLLALQFAVIAAGCSGGGGGGAAAPGQPFIAAELDSFPAGSVPTGFTRNASVAVLDDSSGASITTATVVMNAVTLTYDPSIQEYVGNVVVAPGGAVTLSVTALDKTYTASATQFTSYPTISAPTSGATWSSSADNTVTWSGGSPATNAVYGLGVLDTADPNALLVWPLDRFLKEFPISTTSYSIPAFSITGGNRLVIAGIATSVVVPNAAPGSSLVVGGFSYAPITVTGMPVTLRVSDTTIGGFSGVIWSGTQFVAVGGNSGGGSILTSPDGITWTSRTAGTSSGLQGVTWSGTQFVAVGANGIILTSPDAITWTSRVSGTINLLYGVAWSGAEFVAVGFYGTILTSPDGITWTSRFSNSSMNDVLQAVVWSGTQYVVAGRDGVILTSPDGITWTPRSSAIGTIGYVNSIIWSGAQFVVAGTYTASCCIGEILTSPDGITWTSHTSGTSDGLLGVAWSGTQFVAVGGSGNSGTIFTSPDGITWTREAAGTTNALYGVAWSGTKFVMVGNGTILTSP
ncbi:MAG TPA: hypothetical protein VEM34_10385 [Burkholderiales bacterium]|nr:hypothetical protein [Burkholderiales bacterium]